MSIFEKNTGEKLFLFVLFLPKEVWTHMFSVGHAALQTVSLLAPACPRCLKRPSFNLLDSLLQEVCIESDTDGSLTLRHCLGLSVCLVSQNLLSSRLMKACLRDD